MSEQIEFRNHVIQAGGKWVGPSPNSSPGLFKPFAAVIHYTASGGSSGQDDVDFFKKRIAKSSAHFVIGRDGAILQVVELNRQAWHAGISSWKGMRGLNANTFGIELDNWGWLTKRADGTYRSYTGAQVDASAVVEGRHKDGVTPHKYWEAYQAPQIESLVNLLKALRVDYPTMTELLGHDDISPGRKTDPGPAFPWQYVRSQFFGNQSDAVPIRFMKVRTSGGRLNVRGGPGTSFDILGKLHNGQTVEVLREDKGWSEIEYTNFFGNSRSGWVLSSYLILDNSLED